MQCREKNRVIRYLISYSEESRGFGFGDRVFDTLGDLVAFHVENRGRGCNLIRPAPKANLIALYDYTGEVRRNQSVHVLVAYGRPFRIAG